MRRWLATLALVGASLAGPVGGEGCPAGAHLRWVTGYLRHSPPMNPTTADGTPIWTPEPIAASGYDLPLGSIVAVEGLGEYRIADRLGEPWVYERLDIAVWTEDEAYEITGFRCTRVLRW